MSLIPIKTDFTYAVDSIDTLKRQFQSARNWQEKYRLLIQIGKILPVLATDYKVEAHQVDGCESAAWLYHTQLDGKHYFLADSDARIVKGLIGVLLSIFHGKSSSDVAHVSVESLFDELGISSQLSPSRTNGVKALATAMQKCTHQ